MYVRVKRIGSRRYVYLADGMSENGRVRQRTLAYLGPITRVALGVPADVRRKVDRKVERVDWDKIRKAVRAIPLTFEELQDLKRSQFRTVLGIRRTGYRLGPGRAPRVEGEIAALSLIARRRFIEMFERIGDRTYRMR